MQIFETSTDILISADILLKTIITMFFVIIIVGGIIYILVPDSIEKLEIELKKWEAAKIKWDDALKARDYALKEFCINPSYDNAKELDMKEKWLKRYKIYKYNNTDQKIKEIKYKIDKIKLKMISKYKKDCENEH